ncbi:MAG: hypothetical protein NXH95_20680 [Pseudomonadaceae bacterium]|nr:hypothetical protein [Pseudomonadaceae bacterium]
MSRSLQILCWLMLPFVLLPAAAATPCSDEPYRAFDFLLGNWQVHARSGELQGKNVITAQENGCLIVEQWQGRQGGTGQSYNYYNPQTMKWYQLWVSTGAIIDYSGGLNSSGAMHLEGHIIYQETGLQAPFTGTWTPQPDGSVLQELKQFNPENASWIDWFTGIYTRTSDAD